MLTIITVKTCLVLAGALAAVIELFGPGLPGMHLWH